MEKLTVDEKTLAWWNSLDDGQRLLAEDEARRYESLSEKSSDDRRRVSADVVAEGNHH